MGAEPYDYVVEYEEDIQAALDKLRRKVFESKPATPEAALEGASEDGTRSILDIMTVSETPDFCTAAPLSAEELDTCFGTSRPTLKMIKESDSFWEMIGRGMARYIIIYETDQPKSIFFGGYSFD